MDKVFEKLWNEFSFELGNYIKSKINNTHDAEDILQEVYIKIFRNIDKLENEAAVKSWLYKITRNTIIDFYKKKKDVSIAPENLLNIEDPVIVEDNLNEEVSNHLKHMLFDLPEKYQEVYELYEHKNMKHKEIGEVLDISVSASKVRLKRAKDHFKKNLIECCDFEVDKYGNIIDYTKRGTSDNCIQGSNKC